MYAVIETGGKQYRVEVGTELEVELLDVEPGQSITLDRVLLVADGAEASVGTPIVDGAAVEAEVVGATRGDKVIAFKYRPKARRRVKKGHRQDLTVLRIADITLNGKSAAGDEKGKKPSKADERKRLEEAAARPPRTPPSPRSSTSPLRRPRPRRRRPRANRPQRRRPRANRPQRPRRRPRPRSPPRQRSPRPPRRRPPPARRPPRPTPLTPRP